MLPVNRTIDALQRLAVGGFTNRDPDTRAVAEKIMLYIEADESISLEDVLGLSSPQGKANWRTARARVIRNAYLKLAASSCFPDQSERQAASSIRAAWVSYMHEHWPQDRKRFSLPAGYRKTINEPLFYATRAWPSIISVKQIESVLRERQ